MRTQKKPGRKPTHYRAASGEVINGLSRRSDGRWRLIGDGRTFVEDDEARAIVRYRSMTSVGPRPIELWAQSEMFTAAGLKTVVGRILAAEDPEEQFWIVMAEQIRSRPSYCATKTGIEQLGYLNDLKKPEPVPSFSEIEKTFRKYSRSSAAQTKKHLRGFNDFVKTTGVKTLRDITDDVVLEYRDHVERRTVTRNDNTTGPISGKQQAHLYQGIRFVLNFVKTERAMAREAIGNALSVLSARSNLALAKPNTIRSHFHDAIGTSCCLSPRESLALLLSAT